MKLIGFFLLFIAAEKGARITKADAMAYFSGEK